MIYIHVYIYALYNTYAHNVEIKFCRYKPLYLVQTFFFFFFFTKFIVLCSRREKTSWALVSKTTKRSEIKHLHTMIGTFRDDEHVVIEDLAITPRYLLTNIVGVQSAKNSWVHRIGNIKESGTISLENDGDFLASDWIFPAPHVITQASRVASHIDVTDESKHINVLAFIFASRYSVDAWHNYLRRAEIQEIITFDLHYS